jgi:hypothetical protein
VPFLPANTAQVRPQLKRGSTAYADNSDLPTWAKDKREKASLPMVEAMTWIHLPVGYALLKCLHKSQRSEVYAARRESDGRAVVLKAYSQDSAGSSRDSRIRREYDIMARMAGPGICAPLDLLPGTGTTALTLILERLPGLTFCDWVASRPPTVEAFITVALQLVDALSRLHGARLIHHDLSPWNAIVDPVTLQTHLIDFGSTCSLGSVGCNVVRRSGSGIAGTLAYMAPEQTGRMNRGVDSRSDLYSLGTCFYHALTGRPPFESNDPLALIHAHIARLPPPPEEIWPEVPRALSRIVLKLLEKEPEARYQSARSLHADLICCKEQLARDGRIDASFAVGAAEAPDRPRFPRVLYGREAEVAHLRELYARVAGGDRQFLFLRGEPGTGKSALVNELRPQLAANGGYLALGKFDPSHDRPYSGWITALSSFVQQLLVESDERLARWRDVLCEALGPIAHVLVDLVPDLWIVLGDVPLAPKLGVRESQARISLALQRFLGVCATHEHPLVVFLDDLQWSDSVSRAVLQDVLLAPGPAALMVIGSYRANEGYDGHLFPNYLQQLADRGVALQQLELGALPLEAVNRMLETVLQREAGAVAELAEQVAIKTGNTPLLIRQFVEHLHDRGLLRYVHGTGWTWELSEIRAGDIPDGAVALMTAKIDRLALEPRSVLEFASCVGDEFDVDLLCHLGHRERAPLEQSLYTICDAGLIAPCPGGFRFVHDRIREATQSRMTEESRSKLHFGMASILLSRIAAADQTLHAIAIVEHLNRGLDRLPAELRVRAIQLNLEAGKQTLASGATATAEHGALLRGRSASVPGGGLEGTAQDRLRSVCAERRDRRAKRRSGRLACAAGCAR